MKHTQATPQSLQEEMQARLERDRRANAYPRLVEALRLCACVAESPKQGRINRKDAARLLRELGEVE